MKSLSRRRFLETASTGALSAAMCVSRTAGSGAPAQGDVLYNGIQLPAAWPPRIDRLTREPMPTHLPNYLPAVIPIDVGRQLLVDDFLIEETTLERKFHKPVLHPENPILKPEAGNHWEKTGELP